MPESLQSFRLNLLNAINILVIFMKAQLTSGDRILRAFEGVGYFCYASSAEVCRIMWGISNVDVMEPALFCLRQLSCSSA